MRLLLLCFLSTFICGLIVAQNPNPSPIIDAYISDQMDEEDLPGVSTIVVKNGQVVWVESYGFSNIASNTLVEDNTVFMLASISKVFTGTAVMRAQEQGFLISMPM